ncbi:MAG TPA: spore coat protein YsxE [Bacillaceae bacterium]
MIQQEGSLKQAAMLYGLRVKFTERYGKVYRISTDKGDYALKRTDVRKGVDFLYYMQTLFQQGYNRIVPVYPSLDGKYAVLLHNSLYYLMPWLHNRETEDRTGKHSELFRELARLHTLSSREVPVSGEVRREHYETTLAQWEKEQETLDDFLERSEGSVYMSPFQLLFCTFYHEIALAQKYAIRKLKEWHETTAEEQKARSVIIHGNISTEHFLYNDTGHGYFINFEESGTASPFHDLLPFLFRTMRTYPKPFDETLAWLDIYFRHFPFKKDEMLLFLGYLAHPGHLFRLLEQYLSAGAEKNEAVFVRRLQKNYWHMKNTEYVVSKLEEKERLKKEASQQSPSG